MRLREARILLNAGEWSGAYYLSGYAVECGLKACIAKQFRRHQFPDLQTVKDSYTHEFVKLLKAGGLHSALTTETNVNAAFDINWAVVKDWSSQSRYLMKSERDARDLYRAVTSRTAGILPWIRARW